MLDNASFIEEDGGGWRLQYAPYCLRRIHLSAEFSYGTFPMGLFNSIILKAYPFVNVKTQ